MTYFFEKLLLAPHAFSFLLILRTLGAVGVESIKNCAHFKFWSSGKQILIFTLQHPGKQILSVTHVTSNTQASRYYPSHTLQILLALYNFNTLASRYLSLQHHTRQGVHTMAHQPSSSLPVWGSSSQCSSQSLSVSGSLVKSPRPTSK